MLKRSIYIDLEGADLTGKSTLLKTTFKESIYSKVMCFHDRGVLTHYLYNSHFDRYPEDHDLWYDELVRFIKYNGIIILAASEHELRKRFFERSDDLFKINSILDINNDYITFGKILQKKYDTVKLIMVDNKTPMQVYEEAREFYEYIYKKVKYK